MTDNRDHSKHAETAQQGYKATQQAVDDALQSGGVRDKAYYDQFTDTMLESMNDADLQKLVEDARADKYRPIATRARRELQRRAMNAKRPQSQAPSLAGQDNQARKADFLERVRQEHKPPTQAETQAAIDAAAQGTAQQGEELELELGADILGQVRTPSRIKGLFPQVGTGIIYGPSGGGKSFLSLHLAAAIQAGGDGNGKWFGFRVRQCNVAYIYLEGVDNLDLRIEAHTKNNDDALKRVRFFRKAWNFFDDAERTIATLKRLGIKVLIVDTLSRASKGADLNGADMGALADKMHDIANGIQGLVIVVHHTGKDESKGAKGNKNLYDTVDGVVRIERNRAQDTRKFVVEKSRDGVDGLECGFALSVHDFGVDDDGDPVTSCFVTQAEIAKEKPKGDAKPAKRVGAFGLKGNDLIVFEILNALVCRDHQRERQGVTVDDLRREVWGKLIVSNEMPDGTPKDEATRQKEDEAKRKALYRARQKVADTKQFVFENERYRMPTMLEISAGVALPKADGVPLVPLTTREDDLVEYVKKCAAEWASGEPETLSDLAAVKIAVDALAKYPGSFTADERQIIEAKGRG